MSDFAESRHVAGELLRAEVDKWSGRPDEDFRQGDEKGTPMDVFVPVGTPGRLSPAFLTLSTGEGFSPARALIESMMPYYEDVDGNFAEQCQSTGFDSRFWDLYLFALLTEQGFAFDRNFNAPDFFCRNFLGDVFVEAVTVNPTTNAAGISIEPLVPNEKREFVKYYQEYMPIKWGSPLVSKLKKAYWKLSHVEGAPIVLAIQDFHIPRAMTFLSHSITSYLYGISFTALYDASGNLSVRTSPRGPHTWGFKTIESGFFNLPDCQEHQCSANEPNSYDFEIQSTGLLGGFW